MGKMLPIPGATGVPDYLATSLEEISVVLVRVRGEVDLLTAPLLKQVLQEAVGRGKDVGVDLHDTTYLVPTPGLAVALIARNSRSSPTR